MGRKAIRSKTVFWFCYAVSYLDRIPRYGKLYTFEKCDLRLLHEGRPKPRSCRWQWQRHGMWGFNFLTKRRLFWPFMDEVERRESMKVSAK